MDHQLTACPFCGSAQVLMIELDDARWAANCHACGATGPTCDGVDEAMAAWNHTLADEDRFAMLAIEQWLSQRSSSS